MTPIRRGTSPFRNLAATLLAGVILILGSASLAVAQTTVTATWDRNSDSYTAGYRLYYGTASGNYQWSIDAGNQVSAPINLTPGSVYYFTVRAYNASYEYGPPSNEATISLSPPAPTAQITATLQNNTTALVTWQTANAATATINGTAVALSGSTTIAVTGATTFTLVARASDGRTATAAATVTPTAPPAPTPTARITATLQDNTTALVTWQTANAATATINGISVPASGSVPVPVSATTTFTIVARAADGRTATASATVTIASSTAPGVPKAMTASASNTLATLAWQAPGNGGTPTHYLIYVGTFPGASNVLNGYNVGNTLSVSGHLPRGTYYARVRAVNGVGTSASSSEASIQIGRKLGKPTSFQLRWSGTKVTMSWTAPSADAAEDVPTDYVLHAGTAPGLSDTATVRVGNVTSFTADVSSGTYYVRVRAENPYGESDFTEDLEVRAPGSPFNPTVLINNGTGPVVDLRWNAPAGGYRPTGYIVEAGSAPGLSDLATLRVDDVTRFVTTAPPGVYYVRVRAFNASGSSGPSNEIVVHK